MGRVLGRGGFCVVNEVTNITLSEGNDGGAAVSRDEHYIHNIVQDRTFMARHCIRQQKDCRYAIKRVQEKSKTDPHHYVNAVVDLATEARFLAVIRHSNIIKMRAMEDASPYTTGFFVVLDKLYDIMPVRLKKWKKQEGGGLKKLMKSKQKKINFWVERMSVAYDLSCALSYLHGMRYVWFLRNSFRIFGVFGFASYFLLLKMPFFPFCSVIYRDLKPVRYDSDSAILTARTSIFPLWAWTTNFSVFVLFWQDNIGFDVRGDVKIFDFGLAKELEPSKKLEDGTYNLTGDTGSPR